MLQFAAQAAHDLIPVEDDKEDKGVLEPVLKAIVNNFVQERNSAEVIAVGLNAIRELCKRCPLAMSEARLRDLAQYKTYKDKGVMMAARSLIAFYRVTNPELLHKKDRGRPTEAMAELKVKQYGETDARDYLPGAEELDVEQPEVADDDGAESDGSEGWEDVVHSDDEDSVEGHIVEEDSEEEAEGEEAGDGNDDGSENDDSDEEEDDDENEGGEDVTQPGGKVVSAGGNVVQAGANNIETVEEKRQKAKDVTVSRILTDADFKKASQSDAESGARVAQQAHASNRTDSQETTKAPDRSEAFANV